jgi:site-specific DNA-methyltransferase (adenine-specific)
MGKAWDNPKTGTVPLGGLSPFSQSQAWHHAWAREVLRVLKPGAHLLAFGGTRTHHRLFCAIEDAGFEIRDTLMWLHGQGFPKSLDVSKSLRKSDMSAPTDPSDSSPWSGWGTALKPAWEAICLARKPLDGTVAHNVQRWGTGALNIDGCRVAGAAWTRSTDHKRDIRGGAFHAASGKADVPFPPQTMSTAGRFPANLILGCSCPPSRKSDTSDPSNPTEAHLPSCPVALLDSQSGKLGGAGNLQPARFGSKGGRTSAWGIGAEVPHVYDRGGFASRFFYCAKASRSERDLGLRSGRCKSVSARARPCDCDKADWQRRNGNPHPTVKPLALMRWLVRLVTPPNGLVLDPFAGSGSTGVACRQQGFRYLGIDLNPDYCRIARARISAARPIRQIRQIGPTPPIP